MRVSSARLTWVVLALLAATAAARAQPDPNHGGGRIAGRVLDPRGSGAAGVVVVICDQEAGVPLHAGTHRPLSELPSGREDVQYTNFLRVRTDDEGRFSFKDIPTGEYRLVAQAWLAATPVKDITQPAANVIRLHGTAEHVRVPSEEAERLVLRPPGKGILRIDQRDEFSNDENFLLIGTKPTAGDPILGLLGWDREFTTHIIGANRMPQGTTTVLGLPEGKIHAAILVADNSPGYGAATLDASKTHSVSIPIVAMWSNARHDPPPRIQRILDAIAEYERTLEPRRRVDVYEWLKVEKPELDEEINLWRKLRALRAHVGPLDRMFELPGGEKVPVADILAAFRYRKLQRMLER